MENLVTSNIQEACNRNAGGFPKTLSSIFGHVLICAGSALALALTSKRRALGALVGGSASALVLSGLDAAKALRRWHFEKVVTINSSDWQVYDFLQDINNWPRFSTRLQAVLPLSDTHLDWYEQVAGPIAKRWDVVMSQNANPYSIAWHAVHKDLHEFGTIYITAAPGKRGAEVREVLEYYSRPFLWRNAGVLMGHSPNQRLTEDLRKLKQLMELGEEVTLSDVSAGKRTLGGQIIEQLGGGL